MIRFCNILLVLTLLAALPAQAALPTPPNVEKKVRNHIRKGNDRYHAMRYAEAEVEYRKALQLDPTSNKAMFNLATTLLRQGNISNNKGDQNDPAAQAEALLQTVIKQSDSELLQSKAYYDLGNIAYHRGQYDQAIAHYKDALRRNPDDDQARYNLRMAQLKKDDKKDNNKDQNKDQNQDQNQDQNKDQNQNQDQNKDQNQDQNKDNQDQNQDQNKDQNQDQQQNQGQNDQQQQQQQQQQQKGMSNQNAEQVLKSMQNKEKATQQRINAQKGKEQARQRARSRYKW